MTRAHHLLHELASRHGNPANLETQFYALNYHSAAGEHAVMVTPNLTQETPVKWLPNACRQGAR